LKTKVRGRETSAKKCRNLQKSAQVIENKRRGLCVFGAMDGP
jgi:hypothetical protein